MAKASAPRKKQNRITLENLSPRDRDFLSLDTPVVMKKYKVEKQAVYDRRFALKKKLKDAGISLEQALGNEEKPEASAPQETAPPKKIKAKRGRAKKVKESKPAAEPVKQEAPAEEKVSESREMMVVSKQVPVIMKPIEINFDNFSIKLNGVPKRISVNPDTNAIEIDL